MLKARGADLFSGIPCLLSLFFGSKGWSGGQDLNVTISGGDVPTTIAIA